MKNLKTVFLTAFAFWSALPAGAADLVLRSGPQRTHLIELYSSEGCSSCPPADAWVSSLKASPRLWKDFVPTVFHVTYWDYLGWKDPLADQTFSARQRAYAASWQSGSVYTPGLVLDGAEWRGWGSEPPASDADVGTLEARVSGDRVAVRFSAPVGSGPYDVYAARLGFGISSRVANGENAGRTLRHDFVVGGLTRASLKEASGAWTGELALPAAPGVRVEKTGLAVWAVAQDGRPVQAVGGMIP
jgi:hypothetical protein